jgi:hypothetical protein
MWHRRLCQSGRRLAAESSDPMDVGESQRNAKRCAGNRLAAGNVRVQKASAAPADVLIGGPPMPRYRHSSFACRAVALAKAGHSSLYLRRALSG